MNQANQTPLEDLRKAALDHYDEASTAIHHWNSSVPQAINYYFDQRILQERRRKNMKGVWKVPVVFFGICIIIALIIAAIQS